MKFRSVIFKSFFGLGLLCLSLGMIFNSCSSIWDDYEECPQGLLLRFVYDYNMEYANAFHNKVDCITVFVYDQQGNLLSTHTETTSVLKDEGYRMHLDLTGGEYRLVAYGGMACDEHSFEMVDQETTKASGYTDRVVRMKEGELSTRLHDFYYGKADVTVNVNKYTEATLPLMKNTNNIRVILQQLNGQPVKIEDFRFSITDDNTLFAHDNSLIPNGIVTYAPWDQGQVSTGTMDQENQEENEVVAAYAEFSTSRLVTSNSPRLTISRSYNDDVLVDIPLNNYLLLLKSSRYSDMGRQEFLDRESDWSLIFFLDANLTWIKTHIVINDWVVRLNHMEY